MLHFFIIISLSRQLTLPTHPVQTHVVLYPPPVEIPYPSHLWFQPTPGDTYSSSRSSFFYLTFFVPLITLIIVFLTYAFSYSSQPINYFFFTLRLITQDSSSGGGERTQLYILSRIYCKQNTKRQNNRTTRDYKAKSATNKPERVKLFSQIF